MITFENIYEYLETNKQNLNFIQRDDVVTETGTSKFQTLFWDGARQDIPLEVKEFLMKIFNITEKDYSFIQIQKYEIGDYILPHKDTYPLFNLVMLSTSTLDGITVEQRDGDYKFFSDVAGTFIDIPKFRWHWVNPVREKTRYTAVYGLNPINDYDSILDQ
jgi:hypothetical protein